MRARHGLMIALLLAAACGKDAPTDNTGGTGPIGGTGPGGGGGSTSTEIEVLDNSFTPNATTVPTGSTMTWTWMGVNPHSVVFSTAGPTNSPSQAAGSFQQVFNTPGVFNYTCGVHGASM